MDMHGALFEVRAGLLYVFYINFIQFELRCLTTINLLRLFSVRLLMCVER